MISNIFTREEQIKGMNYKRLVLITIAGLIVAISLSGCGRGKFVTINGDTISKDEFYKRLEQMPVGNPPRPAGLVMLDQMINERLLLELAKEKNVYPTEAQINKKLALEKKGGNLANGLEQRGITIDDFKQELLIRQAQINIITKGIKVENAEVKKFYEANKDAPVFTTPEKVEIAAIICNSESRIRKAEQQIKQGTDFSTVAMNLSEDENTRKVGGKQSGAIWRGREGVPPAVIENAFKLKVNGISDPFKLKKADNTDLWIIIQTLSRKPKVVSSFNDVKDQIREGIAMAKGQSKVNLPELITKKRIASEISIKSERYKGVTQSLEEEKKAGKKSKGK